MALPRTHQASFTPGEIEFIAGDEKIMIIPKVKMPKMKFISVSFEFNYFKDVQLKKTFFFKKNIGRHWTFSTTFAY